MYTIQNFSTKKNVVQQLKTASVAVNLSFTAKTALKSTRNPLKGLIVKNKEGGDQNIITV